MCCPSLPICCIVRLCTKLSSCTESYWYLEDFFLPVLHSRRGCSLLQAFCLIPLGICNCSSYITNHYIKVDLRFNYYRTCPPPLWILFDFYFFVPLSLAKAREIKTHSFVHLSVCPSVTKTLTWLISSEALIIKHWYLEWMILVIIPLTWHQALTLTFDLFQGQICCRMGD